MAVLLVALGFGLLIFFIGLSLISAHNKEEEKREKARLIVEDIRRELSEEELAALDRENRTYSLGLLFGGEGLVLSVLSSAALLINGLVIKIPWYISLPAVLCCLAAAFIHNTLKMYRG